MTKFVLDPATTTKITQPIQHDFKVLETKRQKTLV